jgi:hypothetical protein
MTEGHIGEIRPVVDVEPKSTKRKEQHGQQQAKDKGPINIAFQANVLEILLYLHSME